MIRTFEKLGLDREKTAIYEMVKSMDTTYNNELGMAFDDFMDQACNFFNERNSHEGISRIFTLFDNSQTGRLTRQDMRRISNELDIYLTSE